MSFGMLDDLRDEVAELQDRHHIHATAAEEMRAKIELLTAQLEDLYAFTLKLSEQLETDTAPEVAK